MTQFAGSSVRRRGNKQHITEANILGSKNKMVGAGGNINADDKRELLRNIAELYKRMSAGEIAQAGELESAAERRARVTENRHAVQAALNDPQKFKAMGAAIANELSETANREGFMRRLFQGFDLEQGNIPRIRINYKTQFGMVASGPSQIMPTYIRNKWVMPPEFFVRTNLLIDEREIAQSTGDILEEKMVEGQEQIMVQEDKTWKRLVDALVGVANPLTTLVGGFTPQALQQMRSTLLAWQLPADTCLFASNVWDDILTNTAFTATFYDPVSQYEIVQTGVIGRILGMTLLSDSYRVPQLQVLQKGDIYVLPRPEFLGGYTSRGPVQANEVNSATNGQGIPGRGWYMWELLSMAAPMPRSVVKATSVSS
jgi:hypothetical protein